MNSTSRYNLYFWPWVTDTGVPHVVRVVHEVEEGYLGRYLVYHGTDPEENSKFGGDPGRLCLTTASRDDAVGYYNLIVGVLVRLQNKEPVWARVVSCSNPFFWYAHQIGLEAVVRRTADGYRTVKPLAGGSGYGLIERKDAEIVLRIPDTQPTTVV